MTLAPAGADRDIVSRLDVQIGGTRVARDTTAPFSVRVKASRLQATRGSRVVGTVAVDDGRTRTQATSLRRCA